MDPLPQVKALPSRPSLEQYRKQAKDLVKALKADDPAAIRFIKDYHPRFDCLSADEVRRAAPTLADAQFSIARQHGFESWPKLSVHIDALVDGQSAVAAFEHAADAVVAGDIPALTALLRAHPSLVRARSTRTHGATLLHYVAANGVESFRRKAPPNLVAVTRALLDAGAVVDAVFDTPIVQMPFGRMGASLVTALPPMRLPPANRRLTTLGVAALSAPLVRAGLSRGVLDTVLDAGAVIGVAAGETSIITLALGLGFHETAAVLAARGGHLDLAATAGLGHTDAVESFFSRDGHLIAGATRDQLEHGFVLACRYGRTRIVDFLLRHGAAAGASDPWSIANPWMGLLQAVVGGEIETVMLLLERCRLQTPSSAGTVGGVLPLGTPPGAPSGAPSTTRTTLDAAILQTAVRCAIRNEPEEPIEPRRDWVGIIEALIDAGAGIDGVRYPTGNAGVDGVLARHGATRR